MKSIQSRIIICILLSACFLFAQDVSAQVSCGWSCDNNTPTCKDAKGASYTWTGYCDGGGTGVCVDECIGGPVTTNNCGDTNITCSSLTKSSTGCCRTDEAPTSTPTPTPSDTPTPTATPTPTSTPTNTPTPTPLMNPKGYLDGFQCNAGNPASKTAQSPVINGWSCDPDDYSEPLEVHIYAGGPAGSGARGWPTTANSARNDIAGECGGNANHKFSWPADSSLNNGEPIDLYAYGINIGSGSTNSFLDYSNPTASPYQCFPPLTDLKSVCNSDGTATISWKSASVTDHTMFALRVDEDASSWNGNCTSPNDGDICNDEATAGFSYTIPNIIPGASYGWWVHQRSMTNGAFGDAFGSSFVCQSASSNCNPGDTCIPIGTCAGATYSVDNCNPNSHARECCIAPTPTPTATPTLTATTTPTPTAVACFEVCIPNTTPNPCVSGAVCSLVGFCGNTPGCTGAACVCNVTPTPTIIPSATNNHFNPYCPL